MMENPKTIIVIDDSASDLQKSQLLVEGTFIDVLFLPSSIYLSDEDIQNKASLVSVTSESVSEENLLRILRDANGGSPLVCFKESPPLKKLGTWLLRQENGGVSEEEKDIVERLMAESLEYYRLASVYQRCLKIITSYEIDTLLGNAADAFINELKVESCVLWLADDYDPDEFTIASVRGLINIDLEGSRFYLSKMEFYEQVNGLMPFEYPETGKKEGFLHVPLVQGEIPIGLMKLGKKLSRKPFTEKEEGVARILADHVAFAIKNLDRIQKLEKITLLDPETKVYSASFFKDFFEKESSKSIRFQRPLSLVYVHLDNYSYLLTQVKETMVHDRIASILNSVGMTLRESDIVSRLDSNRFCILLPETDYLGALITIKRLRKAIKDDLKLDFLDRRLSLQIMMRAVSSPDDGKSLDELARSVDKKFFSYKKSPVYKFQLQDKSFWDIFEIILGDFSKYKQGDIERLQQKNLKVKSHYGKNRYFSIESKDFTNIVEIISQDLCAGIRERGMLLLAGPRPELIQQLLSSFELDKIPSKKIFILGKKAIAKFETKNILTVPTDDERLDSTYVLLYLKNSGAYALMMKTLNGNLLGFNSSDEVLVETLFEKIQDMYMIQGSF